MTDILNPSFIDSSLESRAITFENPTGARGAGGTAAVAARVRRAG